MKIAGIERRRRVSEIPPEEIAAMDARLEQMYADLDPERRAFKIAGKRPWQILDLAIFGPVEEWPGASVAATPPSPNPEAP